MSGGAGGALYDRIGVGYQSTRRADPQIAQQLADLISIAPAGRYLDLACGSGNYTRALASRGGDWSGVDPSDHMLRLARRAAGDAPIQRIRWRRARAESLPFPDAVFDGVLCINAIHHFADLGSAFSEVYRVMRGGTFALFSGMPEQMRDSWLVEYFPEMMRRSMETMPSESQTLHALRDAGFEEIRTLEYTVTPELEDLFLYAGKQRPRLYLDPRVRAGISSFSQLSDPREVATGLARLAADLQSGRFQRVSARHTSDRGDYLILSAQAGASRSERVVR